MRWGIALTVVAFFAAPGALAQDDAERAQELFAEGERAYAEGQFTEAAGFMREAYRLAPDPILLYNLARALEGAHDWEAAAEAYSQYLESPGELTHRGRAEAHLRAAQQEVERDRALQEAARPQEPEPAEPEPEPPVAPSRPIDPVPWSIMGGGVLLGAVGIVFGVLTLDREAAANAAVDHEAAYPIAVEGEAFAITADVLFVAGGLAAAVGLVWGIIDLSSPAAQVEVAIGPASIALRRAF